MCSLSLPDAVITKRERRVSLSDTLETFEIARLPYVDVVGDVRNVENPNYCAVGIARDMRLAGFATSLVHDLVARCFDNLKKQIRALPKPSTEKVASPSAQARRRQWKTRPHVPNPTVDKPAESVASIKLSAHAQTFVPRVGEPAAKVASASSFLFDELELVQTCTPAYDQLQLGHNFHGLSRSAESLWQPDKKKCASAAKPRGRRRSSGNQHRG